MKIQMIALIFSVCLLTVTPLFSMKRLRESEAIKVPIKHLHPTCRPTLGKIQKKDKREERQGIGCFCKDIFGEILCRVSYKALLNFSEASKEMNKHSYYLQVWNNFIKKEKIPLNPEICTICQVKAHFDRFRDPQKIYTITSSIYKSFKQQPYKGSNAWLFSIGSEKWLMITTGKFDSFVHSDKNVPINLFWRDCWGSKFPSFPCYNYSFIDTVHNESPLGGFLWQTSTMVNVNKVVENSIKILKLEDYEDFKRQEQEKQNKGCSTLTPFRRLNLF
jgi:hypothetical protein